jgi:membrane protein
MVSSAGNAAVPGRRAQTPTQIPARGWLQVVRRAFAEAKADNVSVLAGGVAFFAFLALFPAIIATLNIYGLVADPAEVSRQVGALAGQLPQSAQPLIMDQLTAVTQGSNGALGVVSVLAALWSASSGTTGLIRAVNVAYDETETRGVLKLRAIALGLTLGAVVFVLLAVSLAAVVPVMFDAIGLGGPGRVLAQILRWALLLALVMTALAVVYRVAPDRDAPRFRWVSTGAVVATVLWLVGTALFSLYVNNFGRYNKTYGTLAGVVVLMLWLYLTAYLVLLGAEINAESERQTERDTTLGEPEPLGTRGAVAADTVAGEDGT